MKVAVTGGRGFIGKKLVDALAARGDRVRVLTRQKDVPAQPGVEILSGDLSLPETELGEFLDGTDVLYHCAGEVNDPRLMRELHVAGTDRLIQAARGRIGRWVQLSSVGAYGPVRSGKITESSPEAPVGEYEKTKTEADALVRSAGVDGCFSTVILRPSIVYGPSMTNQSLFQLIGAVHRGWFVYIGKAGASANYIHVDDVVRALLLCGEKPEAGGQTFIVSDHCTIEDFVSLISKALGCGPPGLRMPEMIMRAAAVLSKLMPGFPLTDGRIDALTNFAWYSDERIRQELGFMKSVSMEDGIDQMVARWHQRIEKTNP